MSFQAFAQCDRDGCNANVQVTQPGALPPGWMQLVYGTPVASNGRGSLTPQQYQPVAKIFCGWPCLLRFAKGYVREDKVVEVVKK